MKFQKGIVSLAIATSLLPFSPVAHAQEVPSLSQSAETAQGGSPLPTRDPSSGDAKKGLSFKYTPIDQSVRDDIFKNRPGGIESTTEKTTQESKESSSETSSSSKSSSSSSKSSSSSSKTSKKSKTSTSHSKRTRPRTTVTVTVETEEPPEETTVYPPEWDGYVDDEISGVEGVDTGSSVDLSSLDLGEAAEAAKQAVKYAYEQLGTPYVWGGTKMSTPHTANGGLDCSGLTQGIYAKAGVSIPRVTYDQVRTGVPVPAAQIQPGDLVFYNGTGHVAIYVGNGEVIHAPQTGDVVKVSSLNMMPVEAIRRVA